MRLGPPSSEFTSSLKNPLLITISSIAVVTPLLALLCAGEQFRSWPELPKRTSTKPHRSTPASPKLPPPDQHTVSAPPPEASQEKSGDVAPISLNTFSSAIAPYWPEKTRHGTIKKFLANGSVRAVIVQGLDNAPSSDDFWASACEDPTARCVLILPPTSSRPRDADNLIVISIDEQTAAAMQNYNGVFVYDVHGRCVHAAHYSDISSLPMLLHALLPAVAQASAPLPPAERGSPATPPGKPSHRDDRPERITLAALDAPLAPLFSAGRTSLLRIDPIRDARTNQKPVVLCFWATYCQPCVAELGELARLRREHPNAVFVGLLDDSDSKDIRDIARKMVPQSFSHHYFLADNRLQSRIFSSVSIPLPAFAVFDAKGVLRDAFVGSLLVDSQNHKRLLNHLR